MLNHLWVPDESVQVILPEPSLERFVTERSLARLVEERMVCRFLKLARLQSVSTACGLYLRSVAAGTR